jgi:cytochrome b6-f complex iron-sulfur subunit
MSETSTSEVEIVEEKMKVNRQEFLNLAWLASLGFLVLEVSGVSILFAYPKFKEGDFGGLYTFGSISSIPEKGAPPLNNPKVKLWLTHTDEGLVALYKVCPHLGCLYGWSDQEDKFICPCHGSQYKHNGDWISGPAPRSLDRFSLQIIDTNGDVLFDNAESDYGPIEIKDFPADAVVQINTGDKTEGDIHD